MCTVLLSVSRTYDLFLFPSYRAPETWRGAIKSMPEVRVAGGKKPHR